MHTETELKNNRVYFFRDGHSDVNFMKRASDKKDGDNRISFTDISVLYVKALWLNYTGKKKEINKLTRTIKKIIALKNDNRQELMRLLKSITADMPDAGNNTLAKG